jgi:hypothetical protein
MSGDKSVVIRRRKLFAMLFDKHISFAVVREKLKESYSDTGRPSIDPELLLRGSHDGVVGSSWFVVASRNFGLLGPLISEPRSRSSIITSLNIAVPLVRFTASPVQFARTLQTLRSNLQCLEPFSRKSPPCPRPARISALAKEPEVCVWH